MTNLLGFDIIIHTDARKMDQFVEENSVDLSIVKPPYHHLSEEPVKHTQLILDTIRKITKLTKINGVCCLIISEDMTEDGMDLTEMRAWLEVIDDPEIGSKWITIEKILWVKSPRKSTESLLPMEDGTLISFDLTPFSTIFVMIRSDNMGNYEEIDIIRQIKNLKISEAKKHEMMESVWFIPQRSESGYKDHLPKELILRLIMLFSKESDLVLDPFSGHGITAVASSILKRHHVCFDKNKENISIAKNRMKNLS